MIIDQVSNFTNDIKFFKQSLIEFYTINFITTIAIDYNLVIASAINKSFLLLGLLDLLLHFNLMTKLIKFHKQLIGKVMLFLGVDLIFHRNGKQVEYENHCVCNN